MEQPMTSEVVVGADTAVPEPIQSASILAVIDKMANSPTLTKDAVEAVEKLLAMQERRDAQERERLFAAALGRVQGLVPPIGKHGRTDKAAYAKLEDIDKAIRPLYAAEGFSLTFNTEFQEGRVLMTARLRHRDGHFEEKALVLPIDTGAGRNATQAVGSTVSYGRRHLTKMLFNVVETDEDDDGKGVPLKISVEQSRYLEEFVEEIGGNKQKFLDWLKVGQFTDISEADYGKAEKFLAKKRDEKTKAESKK
jgi:hypothetical protein